MSTSENLQAAFAGESQANRKYLAYAKKAEEDGYPQAARLFRAVAAAETVHAHNHLRVMDGIKTTKENLEAAISGEHYEVNTMYPDFLKVAEEEKHTKAQRTFRHAMEVEKVHEVMYKEALAGLGKPGEEYDYYVCPICGYTHPRNAPEKCPVCGVAGSKFEKIS